MSAGSSKTTFQKIANIQAVPLIIMLVWSASEIMSTDIPFWAQIGIFLLLTVAPAWFGLCYGWALKKEFNQ
jgi:hypothetical protein